MSNSENTALQESLKHEFESWQKQYYDDVYSLFEKKDEHRLVIALERWEDRFMLFLQNNFPRLVDSYEIQTTPSISLNYIGDPIKNFKPYRSNQIEAFLTQCIEDAKRGNLNNYYVGPKKQKRSRKTSAITKPGKRSTDDPPTIIYNIQNVYGSIGNNNTVNFIQQKFEPVYEAIEASSRDVTEKEDLVGEIGEIKSEVIKGDDASETFLSRRLRNLKKMAPDIAEVALSALAGPGAAFGTIVKNIAKKIKDE